jgi:multimeric flavodoxin WrbA
MKVIALVGSPRKGGNTDILASEFLRGAKEAGADVEKVYLDDLWIRPIAEVGDVVTERADPRSDDDFPQLLERFLDASIAVIASPVYWCGVSAQMKCFIDRLSSYFRRPPYAGRFDGKGYVVLSTFGSNEPDHGKWVTEPVKVSVDFLRGKYIGDICVSAYKKGEIKQMAGVLERAYKFGKDAIKQMSE